MSPSEMHEFGLTKLDTWVVEAPVEAVSLLSPAFGELEEVSLVGVVEELSLDFFFVEERGARPRLSFDLGFLDVSREVFKDL